VMIRGIEGRDIFFDDSDREDFLSRVRELSLDTGTRILAWTLMDNHAHLLIFSGKTGLAAFMRKLLTGYAVRFNRRHRRVGHLFQNRYKSVVCEEDPYLLELVRYIHLNPLRGSVVKDWEELQTYRWSGHGVLAGKFRNDWQETEYVLRLFGGERKKAIRIYLRFMEEGKDMGRRPELVGGGLIRSLGGWSKVISLRHGGEKQEYDSRILGSGEFVQALLREADESMARQMRPKPRESLLKKEMKDFCIQAGVEIGELCGGSQRRAVAEVRSKVAYRLNREMGIPMAEIARYLGVGASAIAMAIRKEERAK
jgi:putative transposase